MTLIKSISGIRGTIGGAPGETLSPLDTVRFTAAYGQWLINQKGLPAKVIVGRDARISGPMIQQLVVSTLQGMGIDVTDLGLSTTPTVEMAVPMEGAQGGIILTASHNPKQWNALKLLNDKGEFISSADGQELLQIAEKEAYSFAEVDDLGSIESRTDYIEKHIDEILKLQFVDVEVVKQAGIKVVVDGVNSTGGIAVPALLERMGVECIPLFCEPSGDFPHNPEPLPEHLTALSEKVTSEGAHLGIVVDPDVDRLALVNEDGSMFGEEYTLVAVADYVLSMVKGHVVSNMSSSRALRDVAERHGCTYTASAVGEVNVVTEMKAKEAVIGGEGNGGVILPDLHYGRDALVGIAIFLTHFAKSGKKMTELKASYPDYTISKNKIQLEKGMDVDGILEQVRVKYASQPHLTIDGLKIEFESEWVHLRKSNTEPIIRIYSESKSAEKADELAVRFIEEIEALSKVGQDT